VEALDTNVVDRLLVRDDEDQCQRAKRVLRQAVRAGGAWMPVIVLVETAWVLRVAYKFDRAATAAALLPPIEETAPLATPPGSEPAPLRTPKLEQPPPLTPARRKWTNAPASAPPPSDAPVKEGPY
jgi:predicted nucleic acid-binding protein